MNFRITFLPKSFSLIGFIFLGLDNDKFALKDKPRTLQLNEAIRREFTDPTRDVEESYEVL